AEEALQRPRGLPARGVSEAGSLMGGQVAAEELPRQRLARHGRAREPGIEPLERARPQPALGELRPEAAHLALPEEVVAGKHLVGAFAGKHDLDAVTAHETR